jgi:predicted flap endonuclease-1-like 5' DNA nuclease
MEWWVWALLIIALLVVAVVIWYWLRMRSMPSAPAAYDSHATVTPHDHDHDHDHDHEQEAPPSWSQPGPTSVAELAAVEVAAPAKADDLALIEGIGPRIRDVLSEAEITTFSQLADMQPDQIDEILRAAKLSPTHPESWPEQARLAAEGKMDELQRLQDSLKGGR